MNLKKLLTFFITIAVFTNSITLTATAASSESSEMENGETEYVFSSTDDEGMNTSGIPKERQKSGVISTIRDFIGGSQAGYNYIIYANGDRLSSQVFVKYLTSSWAPATLYSWSESNSCQWTYSGDVVFGEKIRVTLGLSKSRTTTYSTTITIPADSSKYSKLAFGSDYFRQFYYVDRQYLDDAGNLVNTYYQYDSGSVFTPTETTYLYVVYQSS